MKGSKKKPPRFFPSPSALVEHPDPDGVVAIDGDLYLAQSGAIRRYGFLLASADSLAWSLGGRRRARDLAPWNFSTRGRGKIFAAVCFSRRGVGGIVVGRGGSHGPRTHGFHLSVLRVVVA